MECSRIPAADKWELATSRQLEQYRNHVRFCQTCRRRVFSEAPEQLLIELQGAELPEDFWLGFWDSLGKKLMAEKPLQLNRAPVRMLRWAAVFFFAVLLVIISHRLPEAPSRVGVETRPYVPDTYRYPLIEEVQNPKAIYYIFQAGTNEKVVMVFDPEMEL